jgi:hypothetical protein
MVLSGNLYGEIPVRFKSWKTKPKNFDLVEEQFSIFATHT